MSKNNTSVDLAKIRRRVLIIQARQKVERRDVEELAGYVLQLATLYDASQDALTEAMTELRSAQAAPSGAGEAGER